MIRVEIEAAHLDPKKHDVTIGTLLVNGLKEAGIPLLASAFVIRGVKHGVLSYWRDGRKHLFDWSANEQDRTKTTFERCASTVAGVSIFKSGEHLDDEL